MRKKYIIISVCLILAIIIGSLYYKGVFDKTEKVEKFSVAEYERHIQQFPSNKVVGKINNTQTAKKKAETIWSEIYGNEVKDKKPYLVFYDANAGVWLVQGSLPKGWIGGTPNILFQKNDGKVLAVWHSK